MAIAPVWETRTGAALGAIARLMALCAGAVLAAIAAVTLVSVIGRALPQAAAVRGDFELVELGTAVAVFWFLPLCQARRGHVTVDILAERLGPRLYALLGLFGQAALAVMAGMVAWRLALGFGERLPFGSEPLRSALGIGPPPFFPETTYELQLPVWIPYGLCLVGAVVFWACCLHGVWQSLNWVMRGGEPVAER